MTTRRPTASDDRRTVLRAVRALVLVCLAVAAQASGQAFPSPSPSPPEPTSTFRVLQAPKRAIQLNEIVDLGTLRIRETATYDFLLVPVRPLISGGGGEPLQIGLSVDNPAVQVLPSEVTVPPSGRGLFEIKVNARWLGVGTHVFETSVTDLNDPSVERPFRIQVTVLDDATIQAAISGLYERYRLYTVGSGKTVTVELSQFETFRRAELADFGALDLITNPGGQTLEAKVNYLGSSREGERIVASPYWRDVGDYRQAGWMNSASNLTFLESIELDSLLDRHTRATRYEVDISMDGQARTYAALLLWGGGGRLQLLDHVIPGVSSVAGFEIQPGLSPTLLADTIEEVAGAGPANPAAGASRWTPENVADQAGVRRCDSFFTQPLDNDFFQSSRNGHLTKDHRVEGTAARTCQCTTDCTSRCEVEWTLGVECTDKGGDIIDEKHHRAEQAVRFDTRASSMQDQPANCPVAVHCGVRECPNSNCGGFSLGINLQGSVPGGGGGGGFSWSRSPESIELIDDWHLEWDDDPCPACIELFDATVQVVPDNSNGNPFAGGQTVTVQFAAGTGTDREVEAETFGAPTPLYSFGRFKKGLPYGISASGCLDCEFSGASTTGTIQGPLNFTLTCRRPDNPGQCPEWPVEVNARATCPACPPDIGPPGMPNPSATLSASPQPTQTITINGEGTYPFPDPLPDGILFEVDFSSPGDTRWSCTDHASGRIVGGPAEVHLTCTFTPPFSTDCILNPAACDDAPNTCQWVWKPFVDVPITEVFWESHDVPGGVEGTLREVTTWVTINWRTIECTGFSSGARLAGSSDFVGGGSAGSTNTDSAPLVIVRNSAQHEFPGPSVPIIGVARDDVSTVTGIQVYVDGQEVSLSDLELNQIDLDTCDEIPELVPGQPCDYYSRFSGTLDVSGIGSGTHHISISATNADGVVGFTEKYLTIAEPPEPNDPDAIEVTDNPDNVSVFVGEGTSWSVTATGGVPPYSYTWEAMGPQATVFEPVGNCCNTTGSSTRTLVLQYAEAHYDGSQVRCRIADSAGNTVVSQSARLWVGAELQIEAHPQDVAVSPGEDATFSVDVSGGQPPYAYQWHAINPIAPGTTVELAGEVAPTLAVESVGSGMDGVRYLCRVTDSAGGTVYSYSALLLVE